MKTFIKENYKSMLLILVMVILALTFGGCRTVKKDWLKENYTATEKLQQKLKAQEERTEKSFQQISETFQSKFQEISNTKTESSSTYETENTTVSGTITAEDGKEKSATIGNTTIKSNGANITFETSSSKSISKEFLENFQQISKQLETERQYREDLQSEMRSTKLELFDLQRDFESYKETQSKEVKKSGFGFGTWVVIVVILLILLAVYILYRYLKNKKSLILR